MKILKNPFIQDCTSGAPVTMSALDTAGTLALCLHMLSLFEVSQTTWETYEAPIHTRCTPSDLHFSLVKD